jgi:uncharacterized YigZ family protein
MLTGKQVYSNLFFFDLYFLIIMEDAYKTIQTDIQGLFKDRGSRFLAFGFPVNDEKQIKEHISKLRKKYHDARHVCYAFRIGYKEPYFRVNDDGEPSGTAGKPILGQISGNELTNILIVVVRYFGGVLLGTPGLINAYRSAAKDCINHAQIIEKTIDRDFKISFAYEQLNLIMRIVKDEPVTVIQQNFESNCVMSLRIRESLFPSIKDRLMKIDKLTLKEE